MERLDKLTAIRDELVGKRQEQLQRLEYAFEKVFLEYYEKYKEWPVLNDEAAVDTFLSSRAPLKDAIMKLDFVLKDIFPTALAVLKRLQNKSVEKK